MAIGLGIAAGASYLSSQDSARQGRKALKQSTAESKRQFEMEMKLREEAVKVLEAIGIPSIESQKIALEYAQLGPSALEQIITDPKLAAEQYDSLKQLGELSGPGLTPEDRADQLMIKRSSGAQAKAQAESIKMNMGQRGMQSSGMNVAQQMLAGQGAASRGAMQEAQLIKDRGAARRQAIMAKANLAGSMESSKYNRDAALAGQRDYREQFNKTQRAGTRNQEQIANKSLIQQDYNNRMAKAQAIANAKTGQAGGYQQQGKNALSQGQAQAKGYADQGTANMNLIGDLAKSYATYKKTGADGGIMGYENGGQVSSYLSVPNSNAGYYDGGLTEGGILDEEGIPSVPDSGGDEDTRYLGGDLVPGDSYAGDRVDAKVNSGEMVLNIEQQQRLMDLLRGLKDLQGLGDEDIVAPAGQGFDSGALAEAPMEGLPPEGLPPAGGPPPMIPDGQPVPAAHGGIMPSEYPSDSDTYSSRRAWSQPRGIHSSLASERKTLEAQDGQQKERKARIKALEVLQKGGK